MTRAINDLPTGDALVGMDDGANRRASLAAAFLSFLPSESVIYAPEELRPYEADGLSVFRRVPLVVVLPDTIEQVRRVLAICRDQQVPVVARGAGTGLSGGAMPLDNGVLLGLAKFNRILAIDPLRRIARVQPGVRNLAISEAAAPHGLYSVSYTHLRAHET